MVKADAYGLGAIPVARALEVLGPFAYGVSSPAEGEELRAAGITRPIIIFSPLLPGHLPRLRAARLTPTLASREGIEAWAASGGGAWHLGVDTGMHRAGVPWTAIEPLLPLIARHPPEGVYTHFHSSELDDGSLEQQEQRFREVIAQLPARPRYLHAENSGAIVRRSPSAWDLVRPGVFLYGVGSGPRAAIQPEPVAALRARVLEVRDVAAGEGVSYDATWRPSAPARIATVACGYADGLRRQLGNRASALLRGARVPIRGVVTMDMAMLDVTGMRCEVGDVITFLGRDGTALLTAEEVAEAGALSAYELLVGLKLRLPRHYHGTA
jgi:alanine racemase